MAEEAKKYLDYEGLKHLVEKLTNRIEASGGGDYLPLTGGTVTGDVTVDAKLSAKSFFFGQGSISGDTSNVVIDTKNTLVASTVTLDPGSVLTLESGSSLHVCCTADFQGTAEFQETATFNGAATFNGDATFEGTSAFNGQAAFNAQADFCGGTYIDTDGHIHLPSGVEIY